MAETAKVEILRREPDISTQDNDTVLLYKRASARGFMRCNCGPFSAGECGNGFPIEMCLPVNCPGG